MLNAEVLVKMTIKERANWIAGACLGFKGTTTDYQEEWQATRYHVGGKMFAMVGGDKNGEPIVTVKLEPLFGELLRGQHKEIVPGYYMNKTHWNSIYLESDIQNELYLTLLEQSYQLIFRGLTKKAQREILED